MVLLAVIAVIVARQNLTAIQMLTLSAGYALYFPLILYLSSRFSFAWALAIAVLVPGALLVNYARWLIGAKLGLLGGPVQVVDDRRQRLQSRGGPRQGPGMPTRRAQVPPSSPSSSVSASSASPGRGAAP